MHEAGTVGLVTTKSLEYTKNDSDRRGESSV